MLRISVWIFLLQFPIALFEASSSTDVNYIEFGNMSWGVRKADIIGSPVPPGNNYFSDDLGRSGSVHLDETGKLHLAIVERDDIWYSAEVFTFLPVGPGRYRFRVLLPNNPPLDSRVAVALFVYADDEHEIDIELSKFLSRYGGVCRTCNVQYVLQPFNVEGNWRKFTWPLSLNDSVHEIEWGPSGQVKLSSFRSGSDEAPVLFEEFQLMYTEQPLRPNFRLHLSIWLEDMRSKGIVNAPESDIRQEAIFELLEFTPMIVEMPD